MILFQSQIAEHQQLAEHYRELAAKREALAAGLTAVQEKADSDLTSLKLLVDKCREVAPSAIASLKNAVLGLFDSGNQPTDPTPDSGDDGGQLIALNGITGECLTTASVEGFEISAVDANGAPIEDGARVQIVNGGLNSGDIGTATVVGSNYLKVDVDHPSDSNMDTAGITYKHSQDVVKVDEPAEQTETPTKLTYAQAIKNRCSACWGYEVKSPADIKAGFINRTNLNFMEAVNLDRSGREFYEVIENYLNKLYYNGQSCQLEDCPKSSLTGQYCDLATPFACVIDPQPRPIPSPTEMVHLSANCGYLRLKQDGRILSAYCWFSRKNIAESWASHLEALPTALIEMRQSKRNSSWKWELKVTGLSMQQVQRLASEKLHQKPSKTTETPALAAGIEPPSDWGKVQLEESGADPMTCILSCGDVVEVIGDRYPQHYGKVGTVEGIANLSELPLLVRTPLGKKPYRRSDLKLIAKGAPQLMTAAAGADDAEDF